MKINVGKANKIKINNVEIVRKLIIISEKVKKQFKKILDL
jgi:hypothetical protein